MGNEPTSESNGTGPPHATRFVLVFIVLVLLQLITYRYLIHSSANDRYLFEVARHTAWTLGLVGAESKLEGRGTHVPPTEARDLIYPEATRTSPAPDTTKPLSAWERWQYQAAKARSAPHRQGKLGPQVTFVLRKGIHQRLRDLSERRTELIAAGQESTDATAKLDSKIIALQQEITAGLQDPVRRSEQQGVQFRFQVIPTCGAIEIMAIFLAAVLSFPTSWRNKFGGLIAGLPILYMVNIIRLCCLAFIGALDGGGRWFTFVHEYVWQAIYVVFVVVLWLLWVEMLVRRRHA